MPNILGMVSFYIKEGVSENDFLTAHKKYNSDFVSKQDGYISHKLLNQGKIWSDIVVWKSMEDAQKTFEATESSTIAMEIMDYIEQIGTDDDIPLYTVIEDY